MNVENFKNAITELSVAKGVDEETIFVALKDALEKAFLKSLGGGEDAKVYVDIDLDNGFITLAQLKAVVEDVTDDYLEITKDDAEEENEVKIEDIEDELSGLTKKDKEKKHDLEILLSKVKEAGEHITLGEYYPIYASLSDMTKTFMKAVMSLLHGRIVEAERGLLYEYYKDHIGELITGTVEKCDDKGCLIDVGRTKVELSKREMIGDEMFRAGDPIRVYIQEVKKKDDGKGAQVELTRSSAGFLKRLFEEEIHEIFDGTVLIKGVAREAGIKSKISVMSTNPDVDATGACIGQGGSRIQKIVAQLGNGKEKEKIDIIPYSVNPLLYVADSLKPVKALGVDVLDEDNKKVSVIVKDDDFSTALGKRGVNVRLARQLTGWDIGILKESEAKKDEIVYVTYDELKAQEEEMKVQKQRDDFLKKSKEDLEKKKEQEALAQKEGEAAPVVTSVEETATIEEQPVVTETKPVVEEVKEKKPAEEVKEKPVETLEVKTTKTLEDLEKELANTKVQKSEKKPVQKKRPHHISDEEVERVKPNEVPQNMMPIYTKEELEEIEKEESNLDYDDNYDDIDLEDYDEYYDDDSR
jgi:N utilization substance protein A